MTEEKIIIREKYTERVEDIMTEKQFIKKYFWYTKITLDEAINVYNDYSVNHKAEKEPRQ
jgi:hypothetical protein